MTLDEIIPLLHQWAQSDHYKLPHGATESQIDDLERNLQMTLPAELRLWLLFCNSPVIGHAGVFGIARRSSGWGIEQYYRSRPQWEGKGWIPIATDSCGDLYAIDVSNEIDGLHPIYFFDQADENHPDYLVASCLWTFLYFLLEKAGGKDYWPFEKEQVLAIDPPMEKYVGSTPFPWDLETEENKD